MSNNVEAKSGTVVIARELMLFWHTAYVVIDWLE